MPGLRALTALYIVDSTELPYYNSQDIHCDIYGGHIRPDIYDDARDMVSAFDLPLVLQALANLEYLYLSLQFCNFASTISPIYRSIRNLTKLRQLILDQSSKNLLISGKVFHLLFQIIFEKLGEFSFFWGDY